jgi:hypothetical protein
MSLNYKILKKRPKIFLRLTGVNIEQFNIIVEAVRIKYNKKISSIRKANSGRKSNLKTLEDKILCLLMYYRCYITYDFLGYLFNLHNSNICRLFKLLEPIVAKAVHIQKDKSLTEEKVYDTLLIDATEQKIQRPSKNQKKYYSGKKKQHNLKTTIAIDENNKITYVSKTYKGSKHDLDIIKKEKSKIPKAKDIIVDKGYIGINKVLENTKNDKTEIKIPTKKNKNKELTKEEKEYNSNISKIRIKVEHKFAKLKSFAILSQTYRSSNIKYYNMRFNNICGITNIKNGFWDLNKIS